MTDEVTAENYFLTSEVTTAYAGSKFNVQGSMFKVQCRIVVPLVPLGPHSHSNCPGFQWFQSFPTFKG
jgi:hypothetical protein